MVLCIFFKNNIPRGETSVARFFHCAPFQNSRSWATQRPSALGLRCRCSCCCRCGGIQRERPKQRWKWIVRSSQKNWRFNFKHWGATQYNDKEAKDTWWLPAGVFGILWNEHNNWTLFPICKTSDRSVSASVITPEFYLMYANIEGPRGFSFDEAIQCK